MLQDKGNVYHYVAAASINFARFALLVRVLNAYASGQLKKSKNKKLNTDIKAYKLSSFTGVLPTELDDLITNILEKRLRFEEAINRANQMRLVHKNQRSFVEETSCESWADAVQKLVVSVT